MANELILPRDLVARPAPVATEVVPSDNGDTVGKVTLEALVNAGRPLANQTEAEAGVQATKAMTPLTTKQAIQAQGDVRFASAAQGALADSATQPGDLATVATTGAYADLNGKPTLGTAAATNATAYATSAQGVKADTAVQSVVAGTNITVDNTDPRNPIVNGSAGAANVTPPRGRPSLASGTPVMTANYTAATHIYYCQYEGSVVPIWDGTTLVMAPFTEQDLALDSNSGHTGYHQSGKNFDLWMAFDGATLRFGTGPAWAGDNLRGTGAGTSEIELKNGIKTNKNSMLIRYGSSTGDTFTAAANRATKVGAVRMTANGQTEFTPAPTPAAGGTNNKLFLVSSYQRVSVLAQERDSTVSWSLATVTTQAANASTNNRISVLIDDPSDPLVSGYVTTITLQGTGCVTRTGIGLDSTSVISSTTGIVSGANGDRGQLKDELYATPGIGLHYVQALDDLLAAVSSAFNGSPYYLLTAQVWG